MTLIKGGPEGWFSGVVSELMVVDCAICNAIGGMALMPKVRNIQEASTHHLYIGLPVDIKNSVMTLVYYGGIISKV